MIIGHILVHEPTGRQAICGGYGMCRWCTQAQGMTSLEERIAAAINRKFPETFNDWALHDMAQVVLDELGLREETRLLADGMAGICTDQKTGQTTVHSCPQTRQRRYVTSWESR
jgi:hypothetical protein